MDADILKVGINPILHFEAIGRLRGLNRAAVELGLSQPAVTHSLKKLEQSLGVRLCVRSRAGFELTEPGKRLLSVAREIKSSLKQYQRYLEDDESFDGLFSVGMLGNISNPVFEEALSNTIRAFPKMKLSLQSYGGSDIQDLVSSGELDVGIGLFRPRSQLAYCTVGRETICHYISENHALYDRADITRDDLLGCHLTWLDIVPRDRRALEAEVFQIQETSMRTGAYANSLQAATMILESGVSVVPLPSEYLQTRRLSFEVRRLDDVFEPYNLEQSLVTRSEFSEASMATTFFLKETRRLALVAVS